VVAIGTSLPEVITSLLATLRGNFEVAAGTVLGSNVFNLCFVLGIAGVLYPFSTPAAERSGTMTDSTAVLVLTVILAFLSLRGGQVGRRAGIGLLVIYAGSLCYAVLAGRMPSS
jgi:cation:H+ antiporter